MRTSRSTVPAALVSGLAMLAFSACSVNPVDLNDLDGGAPAAGTTPCTSNYHAGVQSVDMTVQNNTGQPLTLDSSHTGRADIGHWGQQPPATLAIGACAEITGYSDSPLGDFYVTATYRLPDGTYIPFSVDSGDDTFNGQVFTSSGMSGVSTPGMSGQQDFNWAIVNKSSSGSEHVHYVLSAEPAASN